jgi:hypothetical protein
VYRSTTAIRPMATWPTWRGCWSRPQRVTTMASPSISPTSMCCPSLRCASPKNIPLVTINSGTAQESQKLGAIMHIGQPEYEAGKAAGERAKAAGITSFVCVNHYSTNVRLVRTLQRFRRCHRRGRQEVDDRLRRGPNRGGEQGERLSAQQPEDAGCACAWPRTRPNRRCRRCRKWAWPARSISAPSIFRP